MKEDENNFEEEFLEKLELSRRGFLRGSLLTAAALAFGSLMAGCASQEKSEASPQTTTTNEGKVYKWTCQVAVPEGNLFYKYTESFVEMVKIATNGALEIKLVPAGTVVSVPEMLTAVSEGRLDCYSAYAGYFFGQVPQAAFFGSVTYKNLAYGRMNNVWFETFGKRENLFK